MVAGGGVGVLVAHRGGRHLVVALRGGAGLVGALRGGGCVGRVLLCVVPADQTGEAQTRLATDGSERQILRQTGRLATRQVRDRQTERSGGQAAVVYSHGWGPWGLGVVLGVDLRRGDLGVARGLGVGGPTVALRGRRRLVFIAEVKLILVPGGNNAWSLISTRLD